MAEASIRTPRGSPSREEPAPSHYQYPRWVMRVRWLPTSLSLAALLYVFWRILSIYEERLLDLNLTADMRVGMIQPGFKDPGRLGLDRSYRLTAVNDSGVKTPKEYRRALRESESPVLRLRLEPEQPDSARVIDLVWLAQEISPTLHVDASGAFLRAEGWEHGPLPQLGGYRLTSVMGNPVDSVKGFDPAELASSPVSDFRFESHDPEKPDLVLLFWRFDHRIPWILLLVSVSCHGLGLLTLRGRTQTRSSWGFFHLSFYLGLVFLLRAIPAPLRHLSEGRLFAVLLAFAALPTLHYAATCTPLRRVFRSLRPVFAFAVLHGAVLLALYFSLRLWVFFVCWGASLLGVLGLIAFSGSVVRLLGRPSRAVDHQAVNLVRLATLVSFAPPVAYFLIRQSTGWGREFQPFVELWGLAFPGIMSYAVIRRNVLRLNELLLEGLAYTLLTGFVALVVAVLVAAVVPISERILPGSGSIWTIAAFTGSVAWLVSPLYRRARQMLEARYHRSQLRYDATIEGVRQRTHTSESLKAFAEDTVAQIRKVAGTPEVTFLALNESGDALALVEPGRSGSSPADPERLLIAAREQLDRWAGGVSRDALLDAMGDRGFAKRGIALAEALNATWLFPLLHEGRMLGLLALGDKAELTNYSAAEVEKLRQLARECALGIYGFRVRQRMIEKRMAEEALHESQERFRRLAENAPDVIFRYRFGAGEGLEYINPSVYDLTQYTPEELYESPGLFEQLLHPDDRPISRWFLPAESWKHESSVVRWVTRNGGLLWVEQRIVVLRDGEGTPVAIEGIARDITERKRAEELEGQLRRSQKLEALGTLAAGVAHDFNNLTSAISSFTAVAKKTLPANHPAAESLEGVEQAVSQASYVSRSLLVFTSKAEVERRALELGSLVASSLKLLRRILPAAVDVVYEGPGDAKIWIQGEENQLQQMFMNLVINARDAMPEGGRLIVRLGPCADGAGPGEAPRVALEVEDTGIGIPPENLERLFEPFFTTKPSGEGTGLGLAMAHGIVAAHGGEIRVESRVGAGTRFIILLPGSSNPGEEGVPPEGLAEIAKEGTPVVLFEEDATIRAALASYLRGSGFEVLAAGTKRELLDAVAAPDSSIELAILELDGRGEDGEGCLFELMGVAPDLPIVVMSARAPGEMPNRGAGKAHLLRKPFAMPNLPEAIRAALRAHAGSIRESRETLVP